MQRIATLMTFSLRFSKISYAFSISCSGNSWVISGVVSIFFLFDQPKDLITVTAIYASRLKDQILPIHLRKRQTLCFLTECNHRHNRIGRASFQAVQRSAGSPATSKTRSAPPCSLCSLTKFSTSTSWGFTTSTSG